MVLLELFMELITSMFVHGHTKWLFSKISSEVKNNRL
jgi:hypothetical protein